MGKGDRGFLSSNYLERWEFTKIEIMLLVGVLLIFLPVMFYPIEIDYPEINKLIQNEKNDLDTPKKAIISKFNSNEVQFNEVSRQIVEKYNEDFKIANEVLRLAIKEKDEEGKKEAEAELGDLIKGMDNIDNFYESIYIHFKSYEYQNKIFIAFGIAVFLLLLTMYLSRKGYTSYTPWLEKLANDKLKFDLKLFQRIDDDEDYKKTKEFLKESFLMKDRDASKIDKAEIFGWKPIDENKKWFSVFTEKLDYRFYEIAFEKLWPEWCEDNYQEEKDADGEFKERTDRPKTINKNPELVPNFSNDEIKKVLEKTKEEIDQDLEDAEKEFRFNVDMKRNEIKEKNLEAERILLEPIIETLENAEKERDGSRKKLVSVEKELDRLTRKLDSRKDEKTKNIEEDLEYAENELKGIEKKIEGLIYTEDYQQQKNEHLEKKAKGEDVGDFKYVKQKESKIDFGDDVEKDLKGARTEHSTKIEEITDLRTELEDSKDQKIKNLEKEVEKVKKDQQTATEELGNKIDLVKVQKNLKDEKNKTIEGIKNEIEDKKDDDTKKIEEDLKSLVLRLKKVNARAALPTIRKLKSKETCLDAILHEIDIFDEGDIKIKKEIKNLMIRKIQNDILYFSVMVNFRRGLQNATKLWLLADEELKTTEKNQIDTQAQQKDVGGQDLEEVVRKLINDMKDELTKSRQNRNDSTPGSTGTNGEELDKCSIDSEDKIGERINSIHCKLINRNDWETPEWRAMGSIYYKWREDEGEEGGIEEASTTFSERMMDRRAEREGITKVPDVDPTERMWKKHRTIRAVNALADSFGFEKKETGNAILFFGIVFALIISTALLNSLDIVIETMQLPLNCDPDCYHTEWEFLKSNLSEYQYLFMLFLCFFPLGILFYHQGTIFLSSKASEELTLGNKPLVFVNFLFLLVQAVTVYFLASSIGDVNAFLSILIVLVSIDAFWVVIFTYNDMKDAVRDAPVFLEWIVFDIIIGMFAAVFMITYEFTPEIFGNGWEQNFHIFLSLLVLLGIRAVVDYTYAWKNFWSLFADAE